jgi:hypothetical protein
MQRSENLLTNWDNFYHIYKNWIEAYKPGITPELSAFIKQNMMRAYFTGAEDVRLYTTETKKTQNKPVPRSQGK